MLLSVLAAGTLRTSLGGVSGMSGRVSVNIQISLNPYQTFLYINVKMDVLDNIEQFIDNVLHMYPSMMKCNLRSLKMLGGLG